VVPLRMKARAGHVSARARFGMPARIVA